MRKLVLVVAFACISSFSMGQDKPDPKTEGQLKEYFFVMLKRGPNRNQDKAAAEELQKGHMAHINKMANDGHLSIAGPFGDDGDWRGILIFNTKNLEETKTLVEQDPMIKAGRLAYEIHPWWSMKGAKLN